MGALNRYVGLGMCLGLTACGTSADPTSGAADLSPTLVSIDAQNAAQSSGQPKQYLGLVVGDSEDKCKTFAQTLISSETSFNTTADILTTIATALGTLFTPLSTVHSFTAAGSIISGSKNAVNRVKAAILRPRRAVLDRTRSSRTPSVTWCRGKSQMLACTH